MEEQWFAATWTAFNWKEWIASTRDFQKSNLVEMKKGISIMTGTFHLFIFSVLFWDREAWFSLNDYNMALHTGVPSEWGHKFFNNTSADDNPWTGLLC